MFKYGFFFVRKKKKKWPLSQALGKERLRPLYTFLFFQEKNIMRQTHVGSNIYGNFFIIYI